MRNSFLFILIIIGVLFSNCKKEETFKTTTIEGKLVNHETQLPIIGKTMELNEKIRSNVLSYEVHIEEAMSDENGIFKFNYTEKSKLDNTLTLATSFDLELEFSSAIINGVEENLFFRDGLKIEKGGDYYFEIELIP